MKRKIFVLIVLLHCITAPVSGLELSADGPIEYDPRDKHLIANDNAQLISKNINIRADRMELSADNNYASATGNVIFTNKNMFILTDSIDYNLKDQQITTHGCIVFARPIIIKASQVYIERRYQKIDNATLFFGQPDRYTPNISAKKFDIRGFRSIHAKSVTYKIGKIPFFYLPACTFPIAQHPLTLETDYSVQNNLGFFMRNDFYFYLNEHVKFGGLFDVYTKRGVLFGPAIKYEDRTPGRKKFSETKFGFIHDRGNQSVRNKGSQSTFVKQDRMFLESKNILHFNKHFDTIGQVSLWSDPEVTRDFRPARYYNEQIPESFIEATYYNKNFILSAFSRLRLNNFHDTVSQIPDLHAEWLPTALGESKFYHHAFVNYSHIKGRDKNQAKHEFDKFDEYYGIFFPINHSDWVNITPMAAVRATEMLSCTGYKDYSRAIAQFGCDFSMLFNGRSSFSNDTWEIQGLKHIVQPVIQYRYIPEIKGSDKNFPIIERDTFDTNIPTINLVDMRNIDEVHPQNMFRVGLRNTLQTFNGGYVARDLLKLDIFQDIMLKRNFNEYANKRDSTLSSSYIFGEFDPANWLSFRCYSRLHTQTMTLQEITTSTGIHDGNVWKLEFLTHATQHDTSQYGLRLSAKLNSRLEIASQTQYDARIKKLTKQQFSLRTTLGRSWNIEYFITIRNKASRESRCQFDVQLDLIEF